MKSKLVVDNDTTLHGVHADTVAFRRFVLIKWNIFLIIISHQLALHIDGSRKRSTAFIVILNHQGSVTLVDVACLVSW